MEFAVPASKFEIESAMAGALRYWPPSLVRVYHLS